MKLILHKLKDGLWEVHPITPGSDERGVQHIRHLAGMLGPDKRVERTGSDRLRTSRGEPGGN